MSPQRRLVWREIVAALMCSRLYFELTPCERLALVKDLCHQHGLRPAPAPARR